MGTTLWALYVFFTVKATGHVAVKDMELYFVSRPQCRETARFYNENKDLWPKDAEIDVFYYCTKKKERDS